MSNFPIEKVRSQFPALKREYKGKPVAYFDGPGGSQTVQSAIQAMQDYLSNGCANLHGNFPTSHETEALIAKSRDAVATLFCAKPHEVAFGPNATTLMCHVSRAIARQWKEGDEIVLTELEHHSNIDTWRRSAEDKGVKVKYIPLDTKALTLDLSNINGIITEKNETCGGWAGVQLYRNDNRYTSHFKTRQGGRGGCGGRCRPCNPAHPCRHAGSRH